MSSIVLAVVGASWCPPATEALDLKAQNTPAKKKIIWPPMFPQMSFPSSELRSLKRVSNELLAKNPDDFDGLRVRAFVEFKQEQFPEVYKDLKHALGLAPKRMTWVEYHLLGESCMELDKPEEALGYFTSGIKSVPPWGGVSFLYLRRSQLQARFNRLDEAIKDADKVVSLNKGLYWPYEYRSHLNESLKRYQNVVDDCSAAIKINPKLITCYARRADAYEKLGNKTLADRDRKEIDRLAKVNN